MAEAGRYRTWRRTVKREAGKPDEQSAQTESSVAAPPLSPLAFAESVFRDASQPMPLRAAMARAALPYMHARAQPDERGGEDARETRPWPFNMPDPYGAIRVDWREALEKAGLITPPPSYHEAARWLEERAADGAPSMSEGEGADSQPKTVPSGCDPDAAQACTAASVPARAALAHEMAPPARSFAPAPLHDLWPDAIAPRRRPLLDRANRSEREAEGWR